MTENFDRVPNQSKPPAATMHDEADDKISTYFKVKNFTSETNNDDITREELKSVQKSIALLKQDIRKIVREEVEGAFQRN